VLTAAPFQFSITVPAGAPIGAYHLTAVGNAGQSSLVESAPVTLYVETSASPTSITIQPPTIIFEAQGEQIPLQVLGTFADGTVGDLSGSSQLAFGSSNTAAATVSTTGVVTAVGMGSASISVSYGSGTAAGIPVTVSAPTVTVSPASLVFPNTATGATSTAQPVVVTNSSSASIALSSVTISGDFSETDNCSGKTIAPAGTCTINVTYAPTLIGQEGGQLTIVNSLDVVPLTVPLSGTGISATSATLVASLTDSGNFTLGQSGATYSISIHNAGNGPLSGMATVTVTLPATLALTALSGTGWNCQVPRDVR
jgi:hypothetical protein